MSQLVKPSRDVRVDHCNKIRMVPQLTCSGYQAQISIVICKIPLIIIFYYVSITFFITSKEKGTSLIFSAIRGCKVMKNTRTSLTYFSVYLEI